jgi:hypothetical protein
MDAGRALRRLGDRAAVRVITLPGSDHRTIYAELILSR